ncbi:MAG: hypothetical protein AUJ18_10340 [Candidatus Hydrogenedentes bacterium CG1_02_42_14]|nr:MAG: hypothetical protein AUJ18_10340 [Candidatus Hydrogenedentes bacterium CG1_02_42_14]
MENDPEMEREGGAGFQCDDTSGTNARNPDDGRHSANDKRQGDPAFMRQYTWTAAPRPSATSRPQRSQAAQRPSVDPQPECQNVVATFCLLGLYLPASLISAFKLLKLG